MYFTLTVLLKNLNIDFLYYKLFQRKIITRINFANQFSGFRVSFLV